MQKILVFDIAASRNILSELDKEKLHKLFSVLIYDVFYINEDILRVVVGLNLNQEEFVKNAKEKLNENNISIDNITLYEGYEKLFKIRENKKEYGILEDDRSYDNVSVFFDVKDASAYFKKCIAKRQYVEFLSYSNDKWYTVTIHHISQRHTS